MNQFLKGLFDSELSTVISISDFLLCVAAAVFAGLIIAYAYIFRSRYTKSFAMTLGLLPPVVCVVIMMVNGNIGTGVAIAGAFGLVRFRSAPGTAREIGAIFLAMGAGLIAGMGYIAYTLLFAVLLSALMMAYTVLDFGTEKQNTLHKTLYITIPEDLNYADVFTPVLEKYTRNAQLVSVRTTNMGSLFRLAYQITLRDPGNVKEFIDELRLRNGNLEINVTNQETVGTEL